MKYKFKNCTIILILIMLLFSTTSFANDNIDTNENSVEETKLSLYCNSCILIEKSTGKVAYEFNSEKRMYPASTTKILTAIIAVEKCNLSDVVTITSDMTSRVPPSYTTAYLRPGEQVTVEELLNCLLIPSANDAGFALAIHISGSVEEFANLMNEKARNLGCKNSNFTNPSGIHDDNHYSTARDMGIIALYATRYPQITDIVCKTSYVLHPNKGNIRTFVTTNTLIKPTEKTYYEYANGMKTGYTAPAGACVISSAKKDNMEFVAVVLDAPQGDNTVSSYRDLDCKTLFEYGFTHYDEIVKVDEKAFSFLNNSIATNTTLNIALKIGVVTLSLYFIVVLLCRKKKRKK